MLRVLTRSSWALVLRGAGWVLFGLLVLARPWIGLSALAHVFGLCLLADGVLTLLAAAAARAAGGTFLLLEGLLFAALGVASFHWAAHRAVPLLVVIGGRAMLVGGLGLAAAWRLRRERAGERVLELASALSALFGVVALAVPYAALGLMQWPVGLYSVAYGMLMVALASRLRRRRLAGSGRARGSSGPTPQLLRR